MTKVERLPRAWPSSCVISSGVLDMYRKAETGAKNGNNAHTQRHKTRHLPLKRSFEISRFQNFGTGPTTVMCSLFGSGVWSLDLLSSLSIENVQANEPYFQARGSSNEIPFLLGTGIYLICQLLLRSRPGEKLRSFCVSCFSFLTHLTPANNICQLTQA